MAVEYRVRWRRDGRQASMRIYQRGESAHRMARGILALEEVKEDTSLATLPDLVEPPVIEEREVGVWRPADLVPVETNEYVRKAMRDHFPPPDGGDGYPGPF